MKLNIPQMVNMSQLFETRSPNGLEILYDDLYVAAKSAGVLTEALLEGLTMQQWEVVRFPHKHLKDFILNMD